MLAWRGEIKQPEWLERSDRSLPRASVHTFSLLAAHNSYITVTLRDELQVAHLPKERPLTMRAQPELLCESYAKWKVYRR